MTPVAVLCGILGGYGLVRLLHGALGYSSWSVRRHRVLLRGLVLRSGAALAAAAVAAGLTTWPAAAPLAAAAAVAVPRLRGTWRREQRREAQVAAIADWTEMLRDALAAAAGIETAIRATAGGGDGPQPPAAIANEVRTLVARLDGGRARLDDALRAFADDLDDAHADMVVAALILASKHQAGKLVEQLTAIAEAIREELEGRERIATERARVRTQVVVILAALSIGLVFYALFKRSYFAPYGSVQGQFVLLIVGGFFATGFALLVRMSRPFRPPRLLTPLDMADDVASPQLAILAAGSE